jgi:peptidyl-tRNA hydrolase, PTH1 family
LRAVIGLGNPGRRYQKTRHNVGFLFLDYLYKYTKIPFSPGKGDYYFSETQLGNEEIVLIKPTSFMNLSGIAIAQAMEDFNFTRENMLVVFDDFHLPLGTLRFRPHGSDGGHNGIKSVIHTIESEDFNRLKIGIGQTFENSVDFVLSQFETGEFEILDQLFQIAYKGILAWIETGIEQSMNLYNGCYDLSDE